MSIDYSRYFGLRERNLPKFYELSQLMDKFRSEEDPSRYLKKRIFIIGAQIVAYGLLLLNSPGVILLIVIPVFLAIVWVKHTHLSEHDFKTVFLERAIDAGHSRAEAAEYLFDTFWYDKIFEKPDLEQIQQELKNAKNQ